MKDPQPSPSGEGGAKRRVRGGHRQPDDRNDSILRVIVRRGSSRIDRALPEWGGEEVIVRYDCATGAWIIIAIHSTRLGPTVGGTRLKSYRTFSDALGDALRLAEGMTNKFAVFGFPRGGAKAVINVPQGFQESQRVPLLHRYARLLRQLGEIFTTGPDVGTSSVDMDIIDAVAPGRAHSRSRSVGGSGSSSPATALGVFKAMGAASEIVFGSESLEGRSVLVQGAGKVGETLLDLLVSDGATVAFTDIDRHRVAELKKRRFAFVEPDEAYAYPCDVFAPCALGGILNRRTIPRLRCKIVVGAANNQLHRPADADALQKRGIVYVPDFVANAGGAMAITGLEALGWSEAEALDRVRSIGAVTRSVLLYARENAVTPEEAARRIAQDHLSAAPP